MTDRNPYGDDAGTRVGKPDTPRRENATAGKDRGQTGAGKEATGGVPKDGRADSHDRSGSEPLEDHGNEKGSGYGGDRGGPKTSSDQR